MNTRNQRRVILPLSLVNINYEALGQQAVYALAEIQDRMAFIEDRKLEAKYDAEWTVLNWVACKFVIKSLDTFNVKLANENV
jgi:hypothetical protein